MTVAANPEVVKVTKQTELMPMDMLDEGVFVRSIDMPYGYVEVGPLTYEVIDIDGTPMDEEGDNTYKRPVWGEGERIQPDYPITVIRGAHPPRAPKKTIPPS